MDKDCDGRVMIAIPWDEWGDELEYGIASVVGNYGGHIEGAYRLGGEGENPSAEDEQSGDAYAPSISDETLALMRHLDDVKATRDRLFDLLLAPRFLPVHNFGEVGRDVVGEETVSIPARDINFLRRRIATAREKANHGLVGVAEILDEVYDALGKR